MGEWQKNLSIGEVWYLTSEDQLEFITVNNCKYDNCEEKLKKREMQFSPQIYFN